MSRRGEFFDLLRQAYREREDSTLNHEWRKKLMVHLRAISAHGDVGDFSLVTAVQAYFNRLALAALAFCVVTGAVVMAVQHEFTLEVMVLAFEEAQEFFL